MRLRPAFLESARFPSAPLGFPRLRSVSPGSARLPSAPSINTVSVKKKLHDSTRLIELLKKYLPF